MYDKFFRERKEEVLTCRLQKNIIVLPFISTTCYLDVTEIHNLCSNPLTPSPLPSYPALFKTQKVLAKLTQKSTTIFSTQDLNVECFKACNPFDSTKEKYLAHLSFY